MSRGDAEAAMSIYWERVPKTDPTGLEAPYGWNEVLASLNSAFSQEPHAARRVDLPEVVVNGRQLSDISDESLRVLVEANEPPTLFCRNGDKVTVRSDENGRTRIEEIATDKLRHHMSQIAWWVKLEIDDVDGEEVEKRANAYTPVSVMKDLMARDWNEVPALVGVVEVPTLRPDGSILSKDGYDPQSRLWMNLPADLDIPPIPETPTIEQVAHAVQFLDEAISEFLFRDETGRANALGLILSSVFRSSITGLIPMAVIDAPTAGTGKTYLASLASVIACGRPAPLSAAPNGNDEELRKRLTAAFMTDEPMIVFDNVDRGLRSAILAQAITSETWNDRVLGASKNVDLTQHAVWVATGNNIEVGGDLPRRCYLIRLDSKLAQPAHRTYKRPDLLDWARRHRSELLSSCFVLARHWFAMGKPQPQVSAWSTFEQWRRFIGGILEAAGIEGFLADLDELQQGCDPEVAAWTSLLTYWLGAFEGKPISVRNLCASLAFYCQTEELPRSLAESLDRAPGEASKVVRLSNKISRQKDRYFTDGGLRIEQAGKDSHEKVNLWRVVVNPSVPSVEGQ